MACAWHVHGICICVPARRARAAWHVHGMCMVYACLLVGHALHRAVVHVLEEGRRGTRRPDDEVAQLGIRSQGQLLALRVVHPHPILVDLVDVLLHVLGAQPREPLLLSPLGRLALCDPLLLARRAVWPSHHLLHDLRVHLRRRGRLRHDRRVPDSPVLDRRRRARALLNAQGRRAREHVTRNAGEQAQRDGSAAHGCWPRCTPT